MPLYRDAAKSRRLSRTRTIGNDDIELIQERVRFTRDLGYVTTRKYKGDWDKILSASRNRFLVCGAYDNNAEREPEKDVGTLTLVFNGIDQLFSARGTIQPAQYRTTWQIKRSVEGVPIQHHPYYLEINNISLPIARSEMDGQSTNLNAGAYPISEAVAIAAQAYKSRMQGRLQTIADAYILDVQPAPEGPSGLFNFTRRFSVVEALGGIDKLFPNKTAADADVSEALKRMNELAVNIIYGRNSIDVYRTVIKNTSVVGGLDYKSGFYPGIDQLWNTPQLLQFMKYDIFGHLIARQYDPSGCFDIVSAKRQLVQDLSRNFSNTRWRALRPTTTELSNWAFMVEREWVQLLSARELETLQGAVKNFPGFRYTFR